MLSRRRTAGALNGSEVDIFGRGKPVVNGLENAAETI